MKKELKRSIVVKAIVEYMLENMLYGVDDVEILYNGFKGYDSYPNSELVEIYANCFDEFITIKEK